MQLNRDIIKKLPISQEIQFQYNSEIYEIISDLRIGKIQQVSLQSFSGLYLSAENGGGGLVVANKLRVGNNETFSLIPLGCQRNTIAIRTVNGYYLSALGCGGGMLYANKKAVGPEEIFEIVPLYPDKVAFSSMQQFYMVDGSGIIRVSSAVVGPFETFTISKINKS